MPTYEPQPSSCAICHGSRWVCEEHPTLPWEHDGWDGAGAPCICNPEGAVEWREVFAEVPPERPLS